MLANLVVSRLHICDSIIPGAENFPSECCLVCLLGQFTLLVGLEKSVKTQTRKGKFLYFLHFVENDDKTEDVDDHHYDEVCLRCLISRL